MPGVAGGQGTTCLTPKAYDPSTFTLPLPQTTQSGPHRSLGTPRPTHHTARQICPQPPCAQTTRLPATTQPSLKKTRERADMTANGTTRSAPLLHSGSNT